MVFILKKPIACSASASSRLNFLHLEQPLQRAKSERSSPLMKNSSLGGCEDEVTGGFVDREKSSHGAKFECDEWWGGSARGTNQSVAAAQKGETSDVRSFPQRTRTALLMGKCSMTEPGMPS